MTGPAQRATIAVNAAGYQSLNGPLRVPAKLEYRETLGRRQLPARC